VAETVALTLEQIAAQKEAADRDRQRQLEWAVVIQRQLDSGCAGDATLVPREGDRERQVERVMKSYEDGSFLIDRLASCRHGCRSGLREVMSNSAADSLRRRPHARRNRSWTIIAFSFAGTLCGRLVDLNKSANSAIALCAS
jgi:hypothetical protein